MEKASRTSGFGLLELLLGIVTLAALGLGGWVAYSKLAAKSASSTTNTKTSVVPSRATDPYAGWKVYTSSAEKITFKYPDDWMVDAQDALVPNDPANTDYIALKSPDGKVVVHWVSEVDGFGDEHTDSYPYNEIIDKTLIPGAAHHYVISGITTLDSKTYYPWIAVGDDTQAAKFSKGVAGNVAFFTGINNINPTTNSHSGVLFSTSGLRTNQSEPALTEARAKAYLSSADMQQAKLILLSLHY